MAIYEKLMGNPFVDAGVFGICEWLGSNLQPADIAADDLKEVVDKLASVMQSQNGWKNLHSLFPNSVLTNPSSKGNRIDTFKTLCNDYIYHIVELGQNGDCLGCGRRHSDKKLFKTYVPLTGSGELQNFFPSLDDGVGYCSACALAILFSPLTLVATAGKFLLLSSSSWKALRYWSRICVRDIQEQVIRQEVTGCYNPGYSNPRNGLFLMTSKMVQFEEMREEENISFQIFYFSNYNQGPELEIFYMPAPVFRFLRYAYQNEFRKDWYSIVRSGYQKVNWKKVKSEEDYKNKTNSVYERLLKGSSILSFFLNQKSRKPRGNWNLLALYLTEVMNMDQERINSIKRVGDFVAECIRKSERDRRLRQLEAARNYRECRNVLRFVIRDRIAQGEEQPLFSLDEYCDYLFPSSADSQTYWSETRDLLLFRIYENLHSWLRDRGFAKSDEDENEEDSTNSTEKEV